MSLAVQVFVAAIVASFLLGAWLARCTGPAGPVERITRALLPALLLALFFVYAETVELCTRWGWSACRLAPAIGIFHGYPLYTPADSGAINGWLYGPVAALLWTPAALAATPLPALTIAAAIGVVGVLGPLFLAARSSPGELSGAFVAFIFGAAAMLQLYPTWYMVSALNSDFAAVGFGLLSCLALSRTDGLVGRRRLAGAALAAVLAVWSKQIEAPLVLAQLAWLWALQGRRAAMRYFGCFCAIGLVVSLAFVFIFGARPMYFNMWTNLSAQPLLGGVRALGAEMIDFFHYTAGYWIVCLVVGTLSGRWDRRAEGWRAWLRRQPWLLPVIAALVLLPVGAVASVKIGGDRNSIHSAYYLIAAATAALAQLATVRLPGRLTPSLVRFIALGAAVLMLGASIRRVASYPQMSMLPPRCLSAEACEFSRQHPGEVYFPWDPLATLLAEGKFYPFEYGVSDRINAGMHPSADQIAAHLPTRLRWVIYPRIDSPRVMLELYLPGFTLAADTGDWLVYTRSRQPHGEIHP